MTDKACINDTVIELDLVIHPKYIGNIKEGISAEVDELILKWNPDIKGVIMSYNKISVTQPVASVLQHTGHLNFGAKVFCKVFKPTVNKFLTGKVTHISESHISLIVYDLFNAFIPRTLFGSNFKVVGEGLDTEIEYIAKNYNLQLNDLIKFEISELEHQQKGILQIVGSLSNNDKSGVVKYLA
mmetsp:Transcript_19987/g.22636  ORF Transcript_19987/g.22636 Transcript_19987/m.22636 type:complete len:184 (-) Transcript_19987:33-584(-)